MEMSILESLESYYASFAYIGVALILFLVGKFIYQLSHKSIRVNHELVEEDNFAFSFSYVGYFIGLLLIIGASIVGESNGLRLDLLDMIVYSLLGMILLNISIWLNNKITLTKFDIKKEIIEDRNEGTGIIEAAISISVGLVLFGAISGESGGYLFGFQTAIIYWVVGLILLFITSKVYNMMLSYDIHEHIEKDNVAVGIGYSGSLIAIGIIIMNALLGDFYDWTTMVFDVTIQFVIGLILLPILRFFADKILLPGSSLTYEIVHQEKANNGAALVEAFSYIGGAILILWCI